MLCALVSILYYSSPNPLSTIGSRRESGYALYQANNCHPFKVMQEIYTG
jgi:hypothetical protein